MDIIRILVFPLLLRSFVLNLYRAHTSLETLETLSQIVISPDRELNYLQMGAYTTGDLFYAGTRSP